MSAESHLSEWNKVIAVKYLRNEFPSQQTVAIKRMPQIWRRTNVQTCSF